MKVAALQMVSTPRLQDNLDCARALLRAGAAHVDVLVFARVVAPVRTTI